MSNDLTNVVKLNYAEATEEALMKTLTSMDLADLVNIPTGVTKNIPFVKMRATGNYTKYTNQTISDVNTWTDALTINTTPMVNFAIDDIDVEEDYINVNAEVIRDATYQIKRRIDWDFFAQVANAKWKYDASGFGLNTWTLTPITLTTWVSQNISATFGKAKAGLTNIWVNGSKLALCIDDFTSVDLTTLGLEAGFNVADVSYTRGFQWMFGWMSTYSVSNLSSSTVLDLATNPSAWDYIVVQWVKLTARAVPSLPWEFDIGADADATAANIILALNGTWTPWATTYIALDDEDRARLEWITATDWTDLITITSKWGNLLAYSSMTNASNDFQAQRINACIMEKWAIKMAFRWVKTDSAREPLKLVTNYFIWARYGLKVTTRGAEKMVLIPLCSAWAES